MRWCDAMHCMVHVLLGRALALPQKGQLPIAARLLCPSTFCCFMDRMSLSSLRHALSALPFMRSSSSTRFSCSSSGKTAVHVE